MSKRPSLRFGIGLRQEELPRNDSSLPAKRIEIARGTATRMCQGTQSTGPSLVLHTEIRASTAVLLAISREFGKSVDWLLTGKTHVEPKKRVAKDSPTLGVGTS